MRLKPFLAFKAKVIKPCSRMLSTFIHKLDRRSFSLKPSRFRLRRRHRRFRTKVVRFRKPFSLRSLRPKPAAVLRLKRRIGKARLRKRPPRHSRRPLAPDGDRFGEKIAGIMTVFRSTKRGRDSVSVSDAMGTGPFPSPITPAFARAGRSSSEEEEEGACRSFESYLAEMIVEDGKVKDLKDVEELLYCWRSLHTPVFVDLVSRFYGEVCKDLFQEEDSSTPSSI